MNETILKMTEAMNKIIAEADTWDNLRKITFMEHAARIFLAVHFLCRTYELAIPEEVISSKAKLDEYYEEDVFDVTFSD